MGFIGLYVCDLTLSQRQVLHQALAYYFSTHAVETSMDNSHDVVKALGEAITAIQRLAGLPVFERVYTQSCVSDERSFTLLVPSLFEHCFHAANAYMLQFFNQHLSATAFVAQERLALELQDVIDRIKPHAPRGLNSVRFLKAAFDEQISWRHVVLNVFQYGYGAHLRWLDSTITDKTAYISSVVAQNKLSLNHLLSIAGFPVTEQAGVDNESVAILQANALGYPVVIKPINLDRGMGVFPHLMSDNDVRHAFQQARKLSEHILIEKHIVWLDYRFMVLNGELIWAIERIPAGVCGDGIHTIKALTERVNQERKVAKNLFQIEMDSDTIQYLASQGLQLDAIPLLGQFVPLKRIANVTAGGTPLPVLDKVHPDNKRLVEDAVKVLKLDIAGIDFISPDISQSHFEHGGKIIEINAQPMAHPLLDKKIVSTLVPHQGRIPIIVLCADLDQDKIIPALQMYLEHHYQGVGIAQSHQVLLNGVRISSGLSLFEKGLALLLRDDVDCLIYCVTHADEVEMEGLPFDRYDCLMLLNPVIKDASASHVCNAFDTLLKACQGPLIQRPFNQDVLAKRSIIPSQLLSDILKILAQM